MDKILGKKHDKLTRPGTVLYYFWMPLSVHFGSPGRPILGVCLLNFVGGPGEVFGVLLAAFWVPFGKVLDPDPSNWSPKGAKSIIGSPIGLPIGLPVGLPIRLPIGFSIGFSIGLLIGLPIGLPSGS